MLDSVFTCPAAVQRLRASPFGSWLDSFADGLVGLGYTPWTLQVVCRPLSGSRPVDGKAQDAGQCAGGVGGR
jgi:hypothetical protein